MALGRFLCGDANWRMFVIRGLVVGGGGMVEVLVFFRRDGAVRAPQLWVGFVGVVLCKAGFMFVCILYSPWCQSAVAITSGCIVLLVFMM